MPVNRLMPTAQNAAITRTDIEKAARDIVRDGKMTQAEKDELTSLLTKDDVTADAKAAIRSFLGMENAGVRNFVVAASSDG